MALAQNSGGAASTRREFPGFNLGGEEDDIDIQEAPELRGDDASPYFANVPAFINGMVKRYGMIEDAAAACFTPFT